MAGWPPTPEHGRKMNHRRELSLRARLTGVFMRHHRLKSATIRAIALAGSLVFAAVVPLAHAQTSAPAVRLPAGLSQVTSVEGITEYALPNGLHVLT
ncbi:MAG: hypothetical protein M3Y55_14540, partial [Pseudomonadota bacterium]|nr:hypothetical protein [Pseudomonadota bacterium]